MSTDSNGGTTLNATAVAVLERELERCMAEIRHYELRERDAWNDYDRCSKYLREAWRRHGELLEAINGR